MGYGSQRVMSAAMFALVWTAGVLRWWHPDPGIMHPVLLAAGGVILGLLRCWIQGELWRNVE